MLLLSRERWPGSVAAEKRPLPKVLQMAGHFPAFEDGMARQPVTGIQMRCHSQLDVYSIVTWTGVLCPYELDARHAC